MRRNRNAKIIATLGPASSSLAHIQKLFEIGADVFRLNCSHSSAAELEDRIEKIRGLEQRTGRPIAIILDLQGPKLRIGRLEGGSITLAGGDGFRLDLDETPGDGRRAPLPHPEIFAALTAGINLLLDDGKLRLEVTDCGADFADTVVIAGGELSDRKGVNVPDVVLPLSPFTEKDYRDLAFGLEAGVDWVAPSFIQRPQDLVELRTLIAGRAAILTKLEKPAAIDHLDAIIAASDGVMVARGDLGVELPPERVPSVQKRICRACRASGKPVVVATQMLESMIHSPIPTRAEASDVAGAVYDGADAVMLSAETAAGSYPTEAVAIMDRIIAEVEQDSQYRVGIEANLPDPQPTAADAICDALHSVVHTLPVAVTVTYTSSGFSTLRAARERPEAPILSLTPNVATARRLSLVWGVHSVQTPDIQRVQEMVERACEVALAESFAKVGETLVIIAGMPFGKSGTTNMLRIARVPLPEEPADENGTGQH
jgi:pyruvate kinase